MAYLMKILTESDATDSERVLPKTHSQFIAETQKHFANIVDLKFLCRHTLIRLNDQGLQKLGNNTHCSRLGSQHQAGSDSLLTGEIFFQISKIYCVYWLAVI